MFWNSKPKCPITENDRIWIEESLVWFKENISFDTPFSYQTITPTKTYFPHKFSNNEDDAYYLLKRISELMGIDSSDIELYFYSEQTHEFGEGVRTTLSENLNGEWNGSTGNYRQSTKGSIIGIEIGQLKNTQSLITTISHELCHFIMMSKNQIIKDDEYLTDLLSIYMGYGIFMINSKFNFTQWQGSTHQGWNMDTQGYLPEQIIAFTLALLSGQHNEKISFDKVLNKSGFKYYKKSIKYINQ